MSDISGQSEPYTRSPGQYESGSELVIGLVSAAGTQLKIVIDEIKDQLEKRFGYTTELIKISKEIIPYIIETPEEYPSEYDRINTLMDNGNDARKKSNDNTILALGAATSINALREKDRPKKKYAFIIDSLKHPEEVAKLREIYPLGFHLVGVYSDEKKRCEFLVGKDMDEGDAKKLIDRDKDEHLKHGQRTSDTFHLSDYFLHLDDSLAQIKNSLERIFDIIFGDPFSTPTFDEYAMHMTFAASLRSADLSRQVGAVIANKNDEIIAMGANDCPQFGGGLYWLKDEGKKGYTDHENGRDYMRGKDSNKVEQNKIIDEIVRKLKDEIPTVNKIKDSEIKDVLGRCRIMDITEYGRVVHAEMEALLCCARNHVSTRGATLYCTTFPCHNCAKHIIAAGIKRVVYIEPYHKSKAEEFHNDCISTGLSDDGKDKVHFEPFVGVGPRKFFDLFSMKLGAGYPIKRKDSDSGKKLEWDRKNGKLRTPMLPLSYLDLEVNAKLLFNEHQECLKGTK